MNKTRKVHAEEKWLIVNADDFGLTEGTNEAIMDLMLQGNVTSTSIMVPALCVERGLRAAAGFPRVLTHAGVHLTLTSGGKQRYRPVYRERALPSLTDGEGYFHEDIRLLEDNADLEEVRLELAAQIVCAQSFGVEPTHLDSHGGSVLGLATGRDFLDPVFELCQAFRLPFNLPRNTPRQPCFSPEQKSRFQRRIELAQARGIPLIDDMISLPYCLPVSEEETKRRFRELIRSVKPGVTQLTAHPARVTEEMKSYTDCWAEREREFRLLGNPLFPRLLEQENIRLLSWREVRDKPKSAPVTGWQRRRF